MLATQLPTEAIHTYMLTTSASRSHRCENHDTPFQMKTQREQLTPQEATTRCFELGPCPHCRLRAAVPDITGFQPCLEEVLLAFVAMLLMQGPKVPEHRNIVHVVFPKAKVLLEDESDDAQVVRRRIRMISGSGFPRPRHSTQSRTATNTSKMSVTWCSSSPSLVPSLTLSIVLNSV